MKYLIKFMNGRIYVIIIVNISNSYIDCEIPHKIDEKLCNCILSHPLELYQLTSNNICKFLVMMKQARHVICSILNFTLTLFVLCGLC